MVWEPFALAVFFGLIVSAGITFIFVWPRIEPEDPDDPDPTDADDADLAAGGEEE